MNFTDWFAIPLLLIAALVSGVVYSRIEPLGILKWLCAGYLVGLALWGKFITPIEFFSIWNYMGFAVIGLLLGVFGGWIYRIYHPARSWLNAGFIVSGPSQPGGKPRITGIGYNK